MNTTPDPGEPEPHHGRCEHCDMTDEECTQRVYDVDIDEPCCRDCYHPLDDE